MDNDSKVFRINNNKGYETTITVGDHTIITDEPVSTGGGNAGPTPYHLFLASLGACKAVTMRVYALRKEIPLKGISINLRHTHIYAEDCEECETKVGRISKVDVEINLFGELTEEQKKKLLIIADKCPVQRTITSEMVINTTLNENATAVA